MRRFTLLTALLAAHAAALADPVSVLFVGNSYTFGRIEPVMSYNVALSTRSVASMRGHFINSNSADWDLRSNLGAQTWDQVVLQEQSDEPLSKRAGLSSNPDWFLNYVDKIEDHLHVGAAHQYRERDFFPGATSTLRTAACQAATGATASSCNALRTIAANLKASASTSVFLYQTWARPDLIAGIAPVGQSFLRAVTSGVATRDMWADGAATDGLIDLWFDDGTHASEYGSYLSALTLFGTLTGLDALTLGSNEQAALDLGISSANALALQRVASEQLGFTTPVPEPGRLALWAAGGAMLLLVRRRLGGGA